MANDEHVAILKQGVAAWNAWRRKNRDVRPDLQGADLSKSEYYKDLTEAETASWLDSLTNPEEFYGLPAAITGERSPTEGKRRRKRRSSFGKPSSRG